MIVAHYKQCYCQWHAQYYDVDVLDSMQFHCNMHAET